MDTTYENTIKRIFPALRLADQKTSGTSNFLNSLKFATSKKDEQEIRRKNIWGDVIEEVSPSKEYVGIQYQVGGPDAPVRNMYLVRYGRQGNDKIYGAELDDGRSLTAKGAERFLNDVYKRGGTITPITGEDDVKKIGGATATASQGALPDTWGVLKALRDLRLGL